MRTERERESRIEKLGKEEKEMDARSKYRVSIVP